MKLTKKKVVKLRKCVDSLIKHLDVNPMIFKLLLLNKDMDTILIRQHFELKTERSKCFDNITKNNISHLLDENNKMQELLKKQHRIIESIIKGGKRGY